ncbi:hypothetical protein K503DRAFT_780998 [Rhizopogon vinicolor AM-OR11-026]|uniref:Uncharacterized protein n=1 Tax=Rhizopogon vinicolor AM-OR11-026 TaxID=1314800 RepID=A0A1B7N857_9AGAM|nr:hypothetical protein K503DRAFT_780998 [Rhizopogon vinicolor AM-OR11-026]
MWSIASVSICICIWLDAKVEFTSLSQASPGDLDRTCPESAMIKIKNGSRYEDSHGAREIRSFTYVHNKTDAGRSASSLLVGYVSFVNLNVVKGVENIVLVAAAIQLATIALFSTLFSPSPAHDLTVYAQTGMLKRV